MAGLVHLLLELRLPQRHGAGEPGARRDPGPREGAARAGARSAPAHGRARRVAPLRRVERHLAGRPARGTRPRRTGNGTDRPAREDRRAHASRRQDARRRARATARATPGAARARPRGPRGAARRPRSDGALAPFPVGVAELALVQLAVRVAWHLDDEVDRPRCLELRELVAAEREDLVGELGAGVDTGRRFDDRLDLLAPVLVRDAERGGVADLGMGQEHALDLGSGNYWPRPDGHVRLAGPPGKRAPPV